MPLFLVKIFLSALVIASVSEMAKRNTFIAALFAALPFTSLLAIVWLYFETKDLARIANLCENIFWAVLPSLAFFIIFPLLLRRGAGFAWALGGSVLLTLLIYFAYYQILKICGIKL